MRSKEQNMKTYKVNVQNQAEILEAIKNDTKGFSDFAKECGYDSSHPFWKDGELMLNFTPDESNSYTPRIYLENPSILNNLEKVSATIQTTSFGDLNMNEYKLFMEAIEKAFKLANYINSMSQWDLDNTFPTVEIEM